MFQWYRQSWICYTFLDDVADKADIPNSKWFTRGWTLQELLAPLNLAFYDRTLKFLGWKNDIWEKDEDMENLLLEATGIPKDQERAFKHFWPKEWTVAQKMSWASKRVTTRSGDMAYCLLGIFNVNMPLLYGEGKRAFIRLQEEIMRSSNDSSIFAWADNDLIHESSCGLLATMPAAFSSTPTATWTSGSTMDSTSSNDDDLYRLTNRDIRIHLPLMEDTHDKAKCFALLGHDSVSNGVAIAVRRLSSGGYTRIHPNRLYTMLPDKRIFDLKNF